MAAICGIYKITEKSTEKSYIGQSKDIYRRLTQHFSTVNRDDENDWHNNFHDHPDSFSFEILEVCLASELDEKESYYIEKYDSFKNGFNKTPGNYKRTQKTTEVIEAKEKPQKTNMLYTPISENKANEQRFYSAITSSSFRELIHKIFGQCEDFYVQEAIIDPETGKCKSIFIVPWRKGIGYGQDDFIYLSFSGQEPLNEEISKGMNHFTFWNTYDRKKRFYYFYNNFGYKCSIYWKVDIDSEVVKEYKFDKS